MLGYLIYDNEGKSRNEWFIDRLIAVSKEEGITLRLVLDTEYKNLSLPDFVIVRCINPLINKYYEQKQIATFNGSVVSEIANDKYKTYLFAKSLDIPVMETFLLADFEEKNFDKQSFVIKSRNGHGGKQVYLVKSQKDYNELGIINKDNYIVQYAADTLGVDTRVYFMYNKILSVVKRKSEKDFRSNFSLGGRAERVKITKEQNLIVNKLAKELSPTFVGIDFIFDKGKWVLNEMEDPVGSRMIYETDKIDVAKEYIKSVLTALKIKK